jgi:hypothetical protein
MIFIIYESSGDEAIEHKKADHLDPLFYCDESLLH